MPSADMTMYEHINELRVRIFHIAISIAIITIFCMSFGLKPLNDSLLYYPVPDPINNIAVQLTSYMRDTLLPPEVKLITDRARTGFFCSNIRGYVIRSDLDRCRSLLKKYLVSSLRPLKENLTRA